MQNVRNYCEINATRICNSVNTALDLAGNVALHVAASQNDHVIVCVLLLKGADPNIKNKSGVTPLVIAIRMKFLKIAQVLLKFGAIVEEHKDNVDLKQLMANEYEALETKSEEPIGGINHTEGLFGSFSTNKIVKGARVERLDEELCDIVKLSLETGQLIPADAAFLGRDEELTKDVIEGHLDDRDDNGATILMKAAYKGHYRLVKQLLELKCEVDAADKQGNTALVWAALKGHLRIVKLLREHGASVDGTVTTIRKLEKFNGQITPLFASSFKGHKSVASYLVQEHCDVNLRCGSGRGRSALMIAAWTRNIEIVKLLLESKAYVDPNVDVWLAKGMVQMKRIGRERNVWTTFGMEVTRKDEGKNRRASLQDKLTYLDAQDNEVMLQMQNLLIGKAGVTVAKMAPPKEGDVVQVRPKSVIQLRKSEENLGSGTIKPYRAAINFDVIIPKFRPLLGNFSKMSLH